MMNSPKNVKEPYLVDVPVKITIWIRPECQREQFEVLKQARPSILFLQSDGGRNEEEWEAIHQNRKMFEEEISWECTVYKIYEEKNLGLYTMGRKAADFIWQHVDRCIFLEDDQIPAVCFFQYCAELLEKYKNDMRIDRICGMNHLSQCANVSADYFFSRHGSIWGTATWRRTVMMRDREFAYGKDAYTMNLLRNFAADNPSFIRRLEAYAKQTHYEGHVAGAEFYHGFAAYGYHQLQIIPKMNMIKNIGCTYSASHADALQLMPRATRRVFNMETFEIDFPMKHPKYMIPDVEYERAVMRLGAYNSPIRRFCRRIERGWLLIIHGVFWQRLKKKLSKRNRLET